MKAKMNKRNIAIVTAAIILVILIVSASFLYLHNNSTPKLETLTIGQESIGQSELIYVAQKEGFFSANGLNVTIQSYATGASAVTGLLNNEVDVAVSTEYAMVSQAFDGSNISVIANIDAFQNVYIIGKTNTAEAVNASYLVGKRIGLSLGTIEEFYLGQYLSLNGLSVQNITEVNLLPSQYINALANGTVDACLAQDTYFSQAQQLFGSNFFSLPVQSGQPAFWLLSSTNSWILTHSDTINRLLKSLKQAEEYTISNPEQAKTIFQTESNYTSAYTAQDWQDNSFSLSLDQSLVTAMQEEAQWIISNQLTNQTQVPNFTNYIYTSGLEAVDPQSVTIIK